MEAVNASFASPQQVTLSGVAPATAYMVGYPYRDAGVLDTAALIQDPTFSPQSIWLAGPVGTLFGTGLNATAVLFLVNVRGFLLQSLRVCPGMPEYEHRELIVQSISPDQGPHQLHIMSLCLFNCQRLSLHRTTHPQAQ